MKCICIFEMWLVIVCGILFSFGLPMLAAQELPNIILILVDDGGWNDFGFHGSNQFPTPNIDALAYSGVILNSLYGQPTCSPSRTAILTSKYPYKVGINGPISAATDYGLPTNLTLLPQLLKQKGYANRLIGKWHLGSCSEIYLPTSRGFDSFYGPWNGFIDYYDHDSIENGWLGYDFRRDMEVEWGRQGEYFTRIMADESVSIVQSHNKSEPLFLMVSFTAVHTGNDDDPLQAPQETIDQFYYIDDLDRRTYAAMAWEMDVAIGKLFEALSQKEMLQNSILIFSSDNGGKHAGGASNWPLRGDKGNSLEAGVRVASFIWSPMLNGPGRVSYQMIHFVDLFPTLMSASGGGTLPEGIDGMDVWQNLIDGSQSPREEILIDIHPLDASGSVRSGPWKLYYDPTLRDSRGGWQGDSGRNLTAPEQSWDSILSAMLNSTAAQIVLSLFPNVYDKVEELRTNASVNCGPIPSNATPSEQCTLSPCLFNVVEDPCEYFDRSADEPLVYQTLIDKLQQYNQSTVESFVNLAYEDANPAYWNGTWNNWMDYPSPLATLSP